MAATNTSEPKLLLITLNGKFQPIVRGEQFEDPLSAALEAENLGEVSGGGTAMAASGEIDYCNIEVDMTGDVERAITVAKSSLEASGAPKGSKLVIDDRSVPLGTVEGLALYLNGRDLPDDVYKNCDINFAIAEIERVLGGHGALGGHWTGATETALYFYGPSSEAMQAAMQSFVASYPLCSKSRLERFA